MYSRAFPALGAVQKNILDQKQMGSATHLARTVVTCQAIRFAAEYTVGTTASSFLENVRAAAMPMLYVVSDNVLVTGNRLDPFSPYRSRPPRRTAHTTGKNPC